jgi:hypothetical protein
MIRKGQRIWIRPEWSDAGDDRVEWRAVEDEDGGRVRIAAVGLGLFVDQTQVVKVEWVSEEPGQ